MLNHRPTFTFNADISFSYILKARLIKLTLFSLAFYTYTLMCSDLQHISHIVSFAWCQSLNEQKAALLSAADLWIEMDSAEQKSVH